jgi:hypothetical protein
VLLFPFLKSGFDDQSGALRTLPASSSINTCEIQSRKLIVWYGKIQKNAKKLSTGQGFLTRRRSSYQVERTTAPEVVRRGHLAPRRMILS